MSLPADPGKPYCKNFVVDTLFRYYGEKCQRSGIVFETHLDLPETLPIPEPDLCVLFGNLLENALESCEKQGSGRIQAASSLSPDGKRLSLVVDNTAPTAPQQQDRVFFSTKHPGPGVGTQSFKSIAAQYQGIADFHWENGIFYASVALESPQQP